jgi:hypothetical protein
LERSNESAPSPREKRSTGRLGAALAAGALVLAGCGSTVEYSGSVPAEALGLPAASADPQNNGMYGPGQDGPSRQTPGGAGGVSPSQVRNPAQQGSDGRTGGVGANLGPGVTDTTIRVGFSIQQNNATVSSIASTYNVQLPDSRGAYKALVAYFNAHGGVAGRKLLPVYHSYDPTSGNADQIGQATCAAFTDDTSVFAALDTPFGSNAYNTCMQQHGRLMLQTGLPFGSEPTWRKYPNQVAADGLPLDQGGALLARHLVGTGFLSRSTKVGAIVRSNADLTHAFQHGFVPALASYGLSVAQTQLIQDPQDSSQISGYTADISSAVLKFQSSGVDRVVFFDVGSYAALVFTQTADKQQYHPRYGFSSMNTVVALTGSGTTAPSDQLVGSEGVSWVPYSDGLATTLTPNGRLCLAILRAASIAPSDAATQASYLQTCQTFFLFKAAADAAGQNLNRDTFIRALEGLGSAFVGTTTWKGVTRFVTNDHSGVSVYRPFAFNQGCKCFVASGDIRAVGTA